jgi:hypothetical protein
VIGTVCEKLAPHELTDEKLTPLFVESSSDTFPPPKLAAIDPLIDTYRVAAVAAIEGNPLKMV